MNSRIDIGTKVLSENDRIASEIRDRLSELKIPALNLVSSPGSGKTSLLEWTLKELGEELNMALVAGDVQTENDARRLKAAGGRMVRPIVTGGACHLDASMVRTALDGLGLEDSELLFIENVGNLVCPASFDLGEDMKVALISTTEGDDKPLKYPAMFRRSSVLVVNKIDLLGLTDFSLERVVANALLINSGLRIFQVSCQTGDGLSAWFEWLRKLVRDKRGQAKRRV